MAKYIPVLLAVCAFAISLCLAVQNNRKPLKFQVRRLVGKTELLEKEVDNIWEAISSLDTSVSGPQFNEKQYENTLNECQNCRVEVNDMANTVKKVKVKVDEFVSTSRNAFKNEKQWQREMVSNITGMGEGNHGLPDFESRLQKLESDNQNLTQRMTEILSDFEDIKKENHALKRSMTEVQNDNKKMKIANHALTKAVLEMQLEQLKNINHTCDGEWESFNGHCYLVVNTNETWDDAASYCKDFDSYLIEITMDAELAFADELTNQYKEFWFWTGATDRQIEGTFVYQHSLLAEQIPDKYWAYGQPDNLFWSQDCVRFGRYHQDLEFDDEFCNNASYFICEKP